MSLVKVDSSYFQRYANNVNFNDQAQTAEFTEVIFHNMEAIRSRAISIVPASGITPFSYDIGTHKFSMQNSPPPVTGTFSIAGQTFNGSPATDIDGNNLSDFFEFLAIRVSDVATLTLGNVTFGTYFAEKYDTKTEQGLNNLYQFQKDKRFSHEMLTKCFKWVKSLKPIFVAMTNTLGNYEFTMHKEKAFELLSLERHSHLNSLLNTVGEVLGNGRFSFFVCCLKMSGADCCAALRALENNVNPSKASLIRTILDNVHFASVHVYILQEALKSSDPSDKNAVDFIKKRCADIKTNPQFNEGTKYLKMIEFLGFFDYKLRHFEPFTTLYKFLEHDLCHYCTLEDGQFPDSEDEKRVKFFTEVILKCDFWETIDLKVPEHRTALLECAEFIIRPNLKAILKKIEAMNKFIGQFPEIKQNKQLRPLIDKINSNQ